MTLNQKQFEVLTFIQSTNQTRITQRSLASCLNISLGTVNQILSECIEKNWICKENGIYHITSLGYEQLRPFHVKRAIILADKFHQRLLPLAATKPVMLIELYGKVMIESLIEKIIATGVGEIYLVLGYLGDQFTYLKHKYKEIILLQNPNALESGTLMSLYLAKDYLENAYIIDENIIIYDQSVFHPYEFTASVSGVQVDWTDEDCFRSKKGIATSLNHGGKGAYQKVGITYFDEVSAKQFIKDMDVIIHMPGGKHKDYLDICFHVFPLHYQLNMKYISDESILRISSYRVLQTILGEKINA